MAFADDKAALQATALTLTTEAQAFLDSLLAATDIRFSDGFNIDSMLPVGYGWDQTPKIDFTAAPVSFTPSLSDITGAIASPPVAPTADFPTTVDATDVPAFSAVAPTLNFPTTPAATLPSSPGVAPVFAAPDIPGAPTVSIPSVPTFESLNLPTSPTIDLPQFSGIVPPDDLVAPTAHFQYSEAVYESTLLDPLKAKLLDNLANGGYGIETADEIALFNRARDREVEAMMTRIDEASQAMAARGFPLPPGELAIHIDRAYQGMQDKMSSVSREITLERAKLYVDNRQFTIKEIRDLEATLINFHNSVRERALNVSRLTVEMSVTIFKSLVERYNARANMYRVQAEVFADKIRAELAKAEIYRTQVDAVKVSSEMQRTQVETYLAQLRGIEVSVDIYKVQMEATKVRADIERLKLEAFKEQVATYTAQVQAKVAEFGMYRSQIEGETAKVQAFDAQVKAYEGQMQAAKIKSDIVLAKLQFETEKARTKLLIYNGQMEQYKADTERRVAASRLQVEYFTAAVGQTRVLNEKEVAQASLQETARKHTTESNLHVADLDIARARAKLEATVEALKLKITGVEFASDKINSQLTALMSSINTLSVSTTTV